MIRPVGLYLVRIQEHNMLGSIGMPEMIIILVIALIIFGPRKLPELGRSLGKSLAEFKRASNELRSTLEEEIRLEDQKAKVEPPKAAEPPPTPVETHSDEPAVMAGASGKVDKSA
jgi:sec-independent protein translocase protein TatA